MDEEKLLAFHERLYFHELDSRDKLIARLQLCLAILSLLAGVMIYLFVHFNGTAPQQYALSAILLVSYVLGTALLIAASVEYIKALWGHHYACIPLSVQIEAYRQELVSAYKDYAGHDEVEYRRFLTKYLSECASTNAQVNTKRYDHCHNCLSSIVYSLPMIAAAGAAAVLGGFLK